MADPNVKSDIQAFWGALYHSLYDRTDSGLSRDDLLRAVDDLEDMFRHRRHMAVVEMPLGELAGKRVLEIGPGAGGHSALFARHGAHVTALDITAERVRATDAKFRLLGDVATECRAIQGDSEALPFADNSFDGVLESCVFQHLARADRAAAFAEVVRVLKPGGVFVGHMLNQRHSTFVAQRAHQLADDPGTVQLKSAKVANKFDLETIGLAHFFAREEYTALLRGCATVDPCELTYELPRVESERRGYARYMQAMWIVYAVK